MSRLGRGFGEQARRTFCVRRNQIMLGAMLLAAWLSMEVYHGLIIEGLPIAVVDHDNSKLSRTIRSYLASTKSLKVTRTDIGSLEELQREIAQGRIAGAVLLPKGLSRSVKRGRLAIIPVAIDMSNILVGKTVYKALASVFGTVGAGVQIALVKKLGTRSSQALARVLPIAVSENLIFNPATNYAVYVVPVLVFFMLHLYVLIMGCAVTMPKNMPGSLLEGLGAYLFIFLLALVIGLVFFYLYLPYETLAPQSGPAPVVLSLALMIVVDLMMAAAVYFVIRVPLLSLQLTLVVGMLSMMFSGVTWPIDMFPRPLAFFGQLIPFTPFAQGVQTFLNVPTRLAELGHLFSQYAVQAALYAGLMLLGRIARGPLQLATREEAR
jgi:ABC-2 type transport system permease protein